MRAIIAAVSFWALGLLLAAHPTLLTGLARMQGAPVDTRLNNYVLEAEYRWVTSGSTRSLWNAPFFHPVANVAAFGDVELGALPPYAIWRLAGAPYDTAFQLWWMTVLTLDYLAFWMLLHGPIGASPLAAAYGAFLFAFASARVNQVGHEQLMAQFSVVAALYGLCRLFGREARAGDRSRATAWVWCVVAAAVAQLYTGFYFGWFFGLALLIAAGWVAALPSLRALAMPVLRRNQRPLIAAGALALLALLPLWQHYRDAARIVGMRDWQHVEPLLPRPQSWIYLGPFSWLYGWQYRLDVFRALRLDQEHRLGLGVVTTVIAALGLYRARRQTGVQLLLLVSATLMLCATTVPIGTWTWRVIFAAVPGAAALRAVARIGLLLLIPAGVGAAYFVDRVRPRGALLALALAASVLEQAQTTPSYDKLAVRRDVQALAGQLDPACESFLFTPPGGSRGERSAMEDDKHQLDAMWAALLTGVPTINGLSGNTPPEWELTEVTIRSDAAEQRIAQAFAHWCGRWQLDPTRVCRIRTPVDWSWTVPLQRRRELLPRWLNLEGQRAVGAAFRRSPIRSERYAITSGREGEALPSQRTTHDARLTDGSPFRCAPGQRPQS